MQLPTLKQISENLGAGAIGQPSHMSFNDWLTEESTPKFVIFHFNKPEEERRRSAWLELFRTADDLDTCIFLFFRNSKELFKHSGGGISFKTTGSDLQIEVNEQKIKFQLFFNQKETFFHHQQRNKTLYPALFFFFFLEVGFTSAFSSSESEKKTCLKKNDLLVSM